MNTRFSYLISKINKANFSYDPFRHIEIQDFLSVEDFDELVSCKEINLREQISDEILFKELFDIGYKMVPFPGAITDHKFYINRRKKNKSIPSHSACESAGVVLRLLKPSSQILSDLKFFIESKEFNFCLAEKFDLNLDYCTVDTGIQKYLDEYEISPHPDLRKKALTYMVNINPSENSINQNHHTHYLKFKPERDYIREYWRGNPLTERCWVPWDWCKTVKQQKKNNSIVIFAPTFDTLHAVKANYNHLKYQRTQIYGNLWHNEEKGVFVDSKKRLDWWDFDFIHKPNKKISLSERISNKLNKIFRKNLNNKYTDKSRRNNY